MKNPTAWIGMGLSVSLCACSGLARHAYPSSDSLVGGVVSVSDVTLREFLWLGPFWPSRSPDPNGSSGDEPLAAMLFLIECEAQGFCFGSLDEVGVIEPAVHIESRVDASSLVSVTPIGDLDGDDVSDLLLERGVIALADCLRFQVGRVRTFAGMSAPAARVRQGGQASWTRTR